MTTVITPIYKSPPQFRSVALQVTCTRQLVPDIIKPGKPKAIISRNSFPSRRICSFRSRRMARFPVRNRKTHIQDTHCEMIVASAAPRTPIFNAKIKTGSSTTFSSAPISVVHIPIRGKPWALIKPFMPVPNMANIVPAR